MSSAAAAGTPSSTSRLSAAVTSLFTSVASSAKLRGLLLAGAVFLSSKALGTAAASKGYKKKLAVKKRSGKHVTAAASAVSAAAGGEEERLLKDLHLDGDEFIALLGSFIAHTEKLQNNPPALIPREDLIADLVLKFLEPYKASLDIRRVRYVDGRSNLIIKYNPSNAQQIVSFVGSHFDVVTANPEEFKRDPFKLTVEGDMLYGRGVTDCLGHVAMLCCVLKQLAVLKPALRVGVACVFIANEENGTVAGVGIDELAKQGELDFCRHAPLFWIDSADVGPTVGTAGACTWEMRAVGYSGHSGVPGNAINALSLAMRAIEYIQQRFYADFPYSAEAQQWQFKNGSSLKPTRVKMPEGGVTNIPREVTLMGDVRFLPFITPEQMKTAVEGYVADLNEHVIRNHGLPHTGGVDRFVIQDPKARGAAGDDSVPSIQGLIEWKWSPITIRGVACDMDSVGYKALCDSIYEVTGDCKPFALTGSLPIIADLQQQGYDVQVSGFGKFDAYHAANEYAKLSDFKAGTGVVANLIDHLNSHLPKE